jgi:hypothetical protein
MGCHKMKVQADAVLGSRSVQFDTTYATTSRPSVAPRWIYETTLLIVVYKAFHIVLCCQEQAHLERPVAGAG